jgi:predicted amidohydrolase
MRISCLQYAPDYRDIAANLARADRMLAESESDIAVLPELAWTGYFFRTEEELAGLGQAVDGLLATSIADLARTHSTAIVTGFLEEADGVYYNSALAFDHRGILAGHYRKVHRFYLETQIFEQGDLGFPVFDLKTPSCIARTGMLVCYDWRFPEAARALAVQGAEFIAMPSNIVTTTGMLELTLRTRAFENKVVLAFADRVGTDKNGADTLTFQGRSSIINFNGDILAAGSQTGQEVVSSVVDLTRTRDKRINEFNDILEDRSPFHYI